MHIKEAQEQVQDIFATIQHPKLAAYIALTEEMGELGAEIMDRDIYEQKQDLDGIKGEMADVLMTLLDLANAYSIDMEEEFVKKLEYTRPRSEKWKAKLADILARKRKQLD